MQTQTCFLACMHATISALLGLCPVPNRAEAKMQAMCMYRAVLRRPCTDPHCLMQMAIILRMADGMATQKMSPLRR